MRTYRLSRTSHAVVLEQTFERPRNFDLAMYWKESTAQLFEQRTRYRAIIAFSPEAAKLSVDWCLMTPAAAPRGIRVPEGWEVYQVEFESQSHAKFVALGLGCQARMLLPKDLADEVKADVRRSLSS